jgi:hypothetical protein
MNRGKSPNSLGQQISEEPGKMPTFFPLSDEVKWISKKFFPLF